ncbi:hypothetical protein ACIO87_31615 [Streptomyces sp. NPDC087218]|uniref:hypothetical protein n=1 Tax=Streptomyces sp. NPDC087218 TaxID=3365769 RepID=UPI0038215676
MPTPMEPDTGGTGPGDGWPDEHRYEVLVRVPAVRDAITASASRTQLPMSAEEFLSRAASAVPLVGRPMLRGAEHGRGLGRKLRFRTGKSYETELAQPVGRALVAVLCSLALHGQGIRSVEQHEDGCTLTADIPSDARTFGGVLTVTVTRSGHGTSAVRARAEIPGQLVDWGRSKQALAALAADLGNPGSPG